MKWKVYIYVCIGFVFFSLHACNVIIFVLAHTKKKKVECSQGWFAGRLYILFVKIYSTHVGKFLMATLRFILFCVMLYVNSDIQLQFFSVWCFMRTLIYGYNSFLWNALCELWYTVMLLLYYDVKNIYYAYFLITIELNFRGLVRNTLFTF